jgi:LPS O-antigen subunit length determinant protein (WzzB/FepE family)
VRKTPSSDRSSEESSVQVKKLSTEEFCSAFCYLNFMDNVSERLEKVENRMISEIRKVNVKLIKLEDSLRNLTNKMENLLKTEMSAIRESLRSGGK